MPGVRVTVLPADGALPGRAIIVLPHLAPRRRRWRHSSVRDPGGCRAARAGHRGAARRRAPAVLVQRRLAGQLRRLQVGRLELSDVETASRWTWTTATSRPPSARSRPPWPPPPKRGPAGDADADLARARPAVLPAPRAPPVHRRRRWSCSSGPTRAGTTTRPSATAAPWSCSTGPGSSARAPRPGRAARHPGGGRRHPGAAAVHPAPGGQGGPPGRRLAALGLWQRHGASPLVTLYRVRHTPARHDFGTRYTRDDLPAQVQETLAELAFVTGLDDIAASCRQPAAAAARAAGGAGLVQNGSSRVPLSPSPTSAR